MLKTDFERFISKYNLSGACEIVKLVMANGMLTVNCLTERHHAFAKVSTTLIDLPDGEYTVIETAQLRSLLGVLRDEIKITVNQVNGIPMSLTFKDAGTKMVFALGDPIMLPKLPSFSIGEKDLGFTIDKEFTTTFIRSATALPDVESFAVVATNAAINVVLGYAENYNTNQVAITVPHDDTHDSPPWFYNTKTFREILMANRDAELGWFLIDGSGLAHVKFQTDGFLVDYYLAPSDSP